jgi:hypothetical protein
MFIRHTILCITLSIRIVSDRDICTDGILYFIFRRHMMLCITVSNTPIADRDVCTVGASLFHVYKAHIYVHYLEHQNSV